MKKETLEKELEALLKEAETLSGRSDLTLATAKFLSKEEQKLGEKVNAGMFKPGEKALLVKQIMALQKRIQHEIEMFNADTIKLQAVEDRLEELKTIFTSGQIEE